MNLYHIGLPGLDLGPPVHAPVDEDVVFYEDGVVLLLGPATILVFLPFIEVYGGGGVVKTFLMLLFIVAPNYKQTI